MWILALNRLLTNYKKSMMGINHDMCQFCENITKTILHVFRECPIAMKIWVNAVPVYFRSIFFQGELEHWMKENLSYKWSGIKGVKWKDLWANVCHRLWMWRNEDTFQRTHSPGQHVMQVAYDYYIAKLANG